jgi:hypothetical protein
MMIAVVAVMVVLAVVAMVARVMPMLTVSMIATMLTVIALVTVVLRARPRPVHDRPTIDLRAGERGPTQGRRARSEHAENGADNHAQAVLHHSRPSLGC